MAQPQSYLLPNHLQDDELTQECKELTSTLPMEKGWLANNLHQYQGFWYIQFQLQALVTCQKDFQAHDTDILLATIPKSGTTWLKALTFALLNRKKYPDIKNHPLVTNNPHALVPLLEIELCDLKHPLHDPNSFSSPRLYSTHLPYVSLPESVKDSSCKIVYLCRNPKDTFVSLWHFANKIMPEGKGTISIEESFDKFCRGVNEGGPFWDHVLCYWKESLEKPEKIMFLRYEDLKIYPDLMLKKLAEFVGGPFSKEEEIGGMVDNILKLCNFDNLSNLEVNKSGGERTYGIENTAFFRQGKVGDWKNHLTFQMIEKLNNITEEKFDDHGLKF